MDLRDLMFWRTKETPMTHSEKLAKAAISGFSEVEKEATYYGIEYPVSEQYYDGEKNTGELGAPVDYEILHESLSARSWQLYLESDIAKLIVTQFVEWVIGAGLNLESEPIEYLIKNVAPNFKKDDFIKTAENRFRLWAKCKSSSHNNMDNTHRLARKAIKQAIVGGDVLCIFRLEDGVTTEVIDGRHIKTPLGTNYITNAEKRGNKIVYGVEINKTGEHVAFYVLRKDGKFQRILAKGSKTGRIQAKLIYGDEYRVDGVRGLPLFAASIEKIKKLDRYIEAIVSGTEERAKIAYFTEHNHLSDGGDPFTEGLESATAGTDGKMTKEVSYDEVNKKIRKTTNKETVNMPTGSTLKSLESTMELRVGDFLKDNMIYICASVGMPYEVATMLYTNSFSASRMASQSFQHILDTKRELFVYDFYKPIYDLFLETEILKGNIQADGYFTSTIEKKDIILKEAYHNARFTGVKVPSADPAKEVKASVLKIQNYLSTIAKETEATGGGDSTTNIERLAEEYKQIMKVIPKEYQAQINPETSTAEFTEEPKA